MNERDRPLGMGLDDFGARGPADKLRDAAQAVVNAHSQPFKYPGELDAAVKALRAALRALVAAHKGRGPLGAALDLAESALAAAPHAPAPVQAAEPHRGIMSLRECMEAEEAAPVQAAPTEPSDCDSCDGTGSGGMGVGCTDCLGTGIDPHASPAPVASQIPANVRDNAACDSSVSHKAAPVAADTLTMALACIRWHLFGECRTQGWPGQPPSPADTAKALETAIASPAPAQEQAKDVVQEAIDAMKPLYSTRAKARRYEWLRDHSGADVRSLLGVGDFTSLDAFIDKNIAARKAQGQE